MKDISPILEDLAGKYVGISKEKLESDITSKLKTATATDISFLENISFKEAKKEFRSRYVTRILVLYHGNISETAKVLGISRRTLHRIIKDLDIDANSIKSRMEKPYYIKKEVFNNMLDSIIKSYDKPEFELNKEFYTDLNEVASVLAEDKVFEVLPLKEAEKLFEKKYFKGLMKNSHTIKEAAKKSNTGYEKLTQKIKKIGLQ